MKFKRFTTLKEGNNTNLRSFLFELITLSGLTLDIENPVVHHTKKDQGRNSVEDLVIMSDHDHRSMHAKYRNKDWDNNAHKPYKYIEVKDILARAVYKLGLQSFVEEQNIE